MIAVARINVPPRALYAAPEIQMQSFDLEREDQVEREKKTGEEKWRQQELEQKRGTRCRGRKS